MESFSCGPIFLHWFEFNFQNLNKNFKQIGNEYIKKLQNNVDMIALLINVRDNNTSLEDLHSSFKDADYIFLSGTTLRSEPRTKQF